jgi:hypothetical protein
MPTTFSRARRDVLTEVEHCGEQTCASKDPMCTGVRSSLKEVLISNAEDRKDRQC